MAAVLGAAAEIGRRRRRSSRRRARYWAVVGNGANRIAAEEIRIKLSELCYKSIACDATEDKKHIDLSSEPLILVCAAGPRPGSNADDVAKEVAIYRAHKAAPIVIATEGEERFARRARTSSRARRRTRRWPSCCRPWPATCSATRRRSPSTRQALPLREARAAIETRVVDGRRRRRRRRCCARCARRSSRPPRRFFDGLRAGAVRRPPRGVAPPCGWRRCCATPSASRPLEPYQVEHGKVGTPGVVVEDLTAALTRGIEELTRPDRRHQAPGQDRHRRHLPHRRDAAAGRRWSRRCSPPARRATRSATATLRTLAALDPAVAEVTGYTRYRVEGDPTSTATRPHVVVDRGGVAREHPVAAPSATRCCGAPSTASPLEREVTVARGAATAARSSSSPRSRTADAPGITLLHVALRTTGCRPRRPAACCRATAAGYAALRDAVTETEPAFREDLLGRPARRRPARLDRSPASPTAGAGGSS